MTVPAANTIPKSNGTALTASLFTEPGGTQPRWGSGAGTNLLTAWFAGIPVYNPFLVGNTVGTPVRGATAPTGNTDLYTVPSGKSAIVVSAKFFNYDASAARTVGLQVKIGGAYYLFTTGNGTLAAGIGNPTTALTGANQYIPNFVFRAGDVVSMACDGANVSYSIAILVFDAASPLKGARLLTYAANSTNVLYTCPSGCKALFANPLTYQPALAGGTVYTVNSDAVTLYQVPSGGSPGSANKVNVAGNTITAGRNSMAATNGPAGVLGPGDKLMLGGTLSGAQNLTWTVMVELPDALFS